MISLKNYFRKEIIEEKAYTLTPYPKAIKLNQNELPYDLPASFKKKLLRRLSKVPLHRYPLTQPERLRSKLAQFLGVQPSQIQIANGSNVIIQAILIAGAVKGKVMILDPAFGVYGIEAKLLGNQVAKVPLSEKDFSFSLKKILGRMRKEKPDVIFLANPNAPTGNLFPIADLKEIVRRAKGLVVIDEAYFPFSRVTLLSALKQFPNLILLRTFSKGLGLGGVRVGYLIAHPDVSEQIGKVLMPYCLSVLSEETALFALEQRKYFDKIISEVIRERTRMVRAMSEMPHVKCFDSAANFILFRVNNAKRCFRYLLRKGILVRDVSGKGHLERCLRVSVGTPRENKIFLQALKKYR